MLSDVAKHKANSGSVSVVYFLVYIVCEILYLLKDLNVLVCAYVAVVVKPQMATQAYPAARSLPAVRWGGRNQKSKGEKTCGLR